MYKLRLKSENNWKAHKSGDLNKLNTNILFETDNEFGFPLVSTSKEFEARDGLIAFNLSKNRQADNMFKAVHFFLDDYKFEQIWTRPDDFILLFQDYGNIISPTFSIWSNQPYALNLYNVYRSRWITRYYQSYNINVLVDVRWSDEKSYDYAFSSIEKNTPIILNTVGTYQRDNRNLFTKGFYQMLRVLEPNKLYVYGEYFPLKFEEYFDEVIYFDSFWKERRKCIKKGE